MSLAPDYSLRRVVAENFGTAVREAHYFDAKDIFYIAPSDSVHCAICFTRGGDMGRAFNRPLVGSFRAVAVLADTWRPNSAIVASVGRRRPRRGSGALRALVRSVGYPYFAGMPDLDLEPHEFRRKGDWIVRHFNVDALKWWATIAGIGGGVIIWVFVIWLPLSPAWLPYALGLAPGAAIIVMYASLEGTRRRLVDPPPSRSSVSPEIEQGRASPQAGRVAAASRAALPKSAKGPKNSRSP